MVGEYLERFYVPAGDRGRKFADGNYALARDVSQWKKKIRAAWPRVQMRSLSTPASRVDFGQVLRVTVGIKSEELSPDDLVVELLLAPAMMELAASRKRQAYAFKYTGTRNENGEYLFDLHLSPELCGKLEYRVRAYPYHRALSHRFEMGLMKWL